MRPVTKEQMFALAKAALEHLEYDGDAGTWRVGSYGRPFGNSHDQDKADILFFAGILEKRDSGELTDDQRYDAEEIWKNLGDFIQRECRLVLK